VDPRLGTTELRDQLGESMADLMFSYFTAELASDFTKCRGQSNGQSY